MGMTAILVMLSGLFEQFFRVPDPWKLQLKLCYNWPSDFRGEVVRKCEWKTTDDGACLS